MLLPMVLCVCVFALCVLTVWASIKGQRLFETQRLLEHRHQNPRRLFETRRLFEVLRYIM